MAFSPDALSSLQREILDGMAGAQGCFFSGGAALSAFYLAHRRSLDLDFFTDDAESIDELQLRLGRLCQEQGWELREEQRYPGFRRCMVSDGAAQTLLDFVHEPVQQVVPLGEKPMHQGLRYDSLVDLVTNKLCAVLGRGDVKDLVDLYFLERANVDLLAFLDTARTKDGGIEPTTLAWVLRATPTDPSRLLLLQPVSAADLAHFRDQLVNRLLERGWTVAADEEGAEVS